MVRCAVDECSLIFFLIRCLMYRRNNRIVWDNASSIILGPSLQYYRESWWDALLAVYSPDRQTA